MMLSTRLPWPLDDGGLLFTYQSAWSVSRAFDTTLIALAPPEATAAPPPRELLALGLDVVRVAHRPPSMPVAALRSAFGRWPLTIERYRSAALEQAIVEVARKRAPDLVFLNSLHLAPCLDALPGTPAVLRAQNVESLWMERYAANLPRGPRRAYARHQARRLAALESEVCARVSTVLALHDVEARALRALAPGARVDVVPMAVDLERFGPRRAVADTVLLTGSFGWAPNLDGLRRFLAEGWPSVLRVRPEARLRVVGKELPPSPPPGLTNVDWVGYVPSMEAEMARAEALVVPLWVGAGVRVKIIEALAAGVPVAATPLAAEGLGLEPDRHYVEAETPADLGEAVGRLLGDPARATMMAEAGRAFARDAFSLPAVGERLVACCFEAMARAGAVRRAAAGA